MDDDILQKIKELFQKYPQLKLKELEMLATRAYQEVQLDSIGQYHPIKVSKLNSDHTSYKSEIKHREIDNINDTDLTSDNVFADASDF